MNGIKNDLNELQNFGDSLERNKHVGLISDQNWHFR